MDEHHTCKSTLTRVLHFLYHMHNLQEQTQGRLSSYTPKVEHNVTCILPAYQAGCAPDNVVIAVFFSLEYWRKSTIARSSSHIHRIWRATSSFVPTICVHRVSAPLICTGRGQGLSQKSEPVGVWRAKVCSFLRWIKQVSAIIQNHK